MHFLYRHDLIKKAQELRKNMTPEEKKIWFGFLRDYPIRFLNQKVIGDYILDFYCSKARLCVELDGNQHLSRASEHHDAVRSGELEKLGIITIRFSNDEVNLQFEQVCATIDRFIADSLTKRKPQTSPPPDPH